MRIGIDIDDVLADFIVEYVKIANGLFGKPEVDAQPVDWEWSNFELTKEQQALKNHDAEKAKRRPFAKKLL
jgi:5'(3')-deoxyribonucleotidase